MLKPTRPYFLRAIYDWIIDNQCTPFLAVHAEYPGVDVPLEFVEDGQITLNILPAAVANFVMDDEAVSFDARFSGVSRQLYVPMGAVLGLYAKENGQGMAFPEEDHYDMDEEHGEDDILEDVIAELAELDAPATLQAVVTEPGAADDKSIDADKTDSTDDKPKPANKKAAKKPTLTIVK